MVDVSQHELVPDHTVLKDQEVSRVALLARDHDTWVPKLEADSEFWADATAD